MQTGYDPCVGWEEIARGNRRVLIGPVGRWLALAAVLLLVLLPYFYFDGESEELTDGVRASAAGEFVRLADGVVHYELAGPRAGTTVVLVHGFSVPYYIWDATFEGLTRAGFTVLRYDLYGRGYSDRPKAVYGMDLFERQLLHLLDALGIAEPVDLIGLSMGGFVSVNMADRHPGRVRALCLLDPGPTSPSTPGLSAKISLAPVIGEYLLSVFGDRNLPQGQVSDFYRPEKIPPGYLEKYRAQMRYKGFKRAILSTRRSRPKEVTEVYERAGSQGRPILLIWGREDHTTPFSEAQKLMKLLPQAEFHAIDEAGHVPHIEQADAVNRILIEFLRR